MITLTIQRIKNLVKSLPENSDGAIITSDTNRRYFTDLKSSAGVVLVFRDAQYLIVDFRYIEHARARVKSCEVIEQKDLFNQINSLIAKHNAKIMSVESASLTVSDMESYKKRLNCVLDIGDELSNTVSQMRAVKDVTELAAISQAQGIAEKALLETMGRLNVGITEREFAMLLDFTMLKMGAEAISFDTIALFGTNTSKPHGEPSDYQLKKGDAILVDFGAVYEGYHSDMTRTFFYGAVSSSSKEIYEIVLNAQLSAIEKASPGMTGRELDAVARSIIEESGYGEHFGHSLGHGVGLVIHEMPNCAPKSEYVLRENNVITIEPGIYIPGRIGVRIEDFVSITPSGNRNLTAFEKKLTVI